jgi:hypothetical protein
MPQRIQHLTWHLSLPRAVPGARGAGRLPAPGLSQMVPDGAGPPLLAIWTELVVGPYSPSAAFALLATAFALLPTPLPLAARSRPPASQRPVPQFKARILPRSRGAEDFVLKAQYIWQIAAK